MGRSEGAWYEGLGWQKGQRGELCYEGVTEGRLEGVGI